MMDINQIWINRFSEHVKELSKYLRYMFNDHLMIVLFIAFSGGALYYRQWLTQIPSSNHYLWGMAILVSLIVTPSPIRTFLKDADIVFLLPKEHSMEGFFKKGFFYSLMIQIGVVTFTYIILIPLHIQLSERPLNHLLVVFMLLFLLKVWNSLLSWRMYYFIEKDARRTDLILRFVFNIGFLYLLFTRAPLLYLTMLSIIAIVWYFSFLHITKETSLKWELLIEEEIRQMARFYRVANLFMDVPHLKNEVKPRKWLNGLTKTAITHEKIYSFLYIKTFVRSGDFLGIYVRLLLISSFILYVVSYPFAGAIIVPFFIYLSSLQLVGMYHQHDNKIWLSIYPVEESIRLLSFTKMLFNLMVIKAVALSFFIIWIDGLVSAVATLVISIFFSYSFVQYYLKKRLNKLVEIF
jgi:ABC-2 type transport system permease protein